VYLYFGQLNFGHVHNNKQYMKTNFDMDHTHQVIQSHMSFKAWVVFRSVFSCTCIEYYWYSIQQ